MAIEDTPQSHAATGGPLDRPLALAQQLQRGLLPEGVPHSHPLHIGALSLPADKVGGDFYDFMPRPDGTFDFVLGDVTGHGLSAALVVALVQATFREAMANGVAFPRLLDHCDGRLHQRLRRRMFVAANYGQVQPRRGQVHLFNAAQQALFFDAHTGCCREVEVDGSVYPLGILGRGGYVSRNVPLQQGDMVVCCSDGLAEISNPERALFGFQRLQRTIEEASAAAPEEVIHHVFQAVLDFAEGQPQSDDLTMLVVKMDRHYQPQAGPQPKRALVGDQRPVALVGLQSLARDIPSALPPTVWPQIQAVVEQHGGVVDRLAPDTLVACFGLPELHEDDPERALLAARASERILRQHGLSCHSGLHIGTVVARADGRLEYSLMGQPLVETLQLLDQAPPGLAYLSAAAFERLEGRLRLPATRKIQHGRPFYVLSSRAKVDWLHRPGQRRAGSIYVGRSGELGRLHRAWRRAAQRRGSPTLVSIIGEAGIGKSRLVEEFLRRRQAAGVLRGQARAYPPESAGLFASMVRHWLAMDEGYAEQTVDRLNERLQGLKDPRLPAASFLAALLGFREHLPPQLAPPAYQAGLVQALALLVQGLARQNVSEPLVLVLEDLHWMDSVSAALLTTLVQMEGIEGGVLILALSRPHEAVDALFAKGRRHTRIALESLFEKEVEQWLRRALTGAFLPEGVLRSLLRTGAGQPLYLEERLHHLRQHGVLSQKEGVWTMGQPVGARSTPQSLNGLILSRVNQLAESARQVLQQASVVGQVFSRSVLVALEEKSIEEQTLQTHLDILIAGQFVEPAEEEGRFAFRHGLIRQAVYEALLPDDRAWLHARVAQHLETQALEGRERHPEVLAHHYTEAGLPQQAIPYWQRAGKQAIASSANAEAIGYLTRGLALLERLPDTSEQMQRELALQTTLGPALMAAKGPGSQEAESAYARARALCRQMGETPQLFPVLFGLWRFYLLRANFQTAREVGEQLLLLAQREDDPAWLLEAHFALGGTLFWLGELIAARDHLEQVIALYEPERYRSHVFLYGQDPMIVCLAYAAWTWWTLGYPDTALERCRKALAMTQALEHPFSLAYALYGAAMLHQLRGERVLARERAEENITLSTDQEFPYFLAISSILRGWVLVEQERAEEGLAQMHQGLTMWSATGSEVNQTYYLILLASAYKKEGKTKKGLKTVGEALAVAHKNGERIWEAELYRLKGDLLLLAGQEEAAGEACYYQALETARQQGAKALELRAAMSLSRLWQHQGNIEKVRTLLAPIYGEFTEGFDTADLQDAKQLITELPHQ